MTGKSLALSNNLTVYVCYNDKEHFFQKMKQFFFYSPPLLVLQTPVSGLTYDLPTNINNLQACLKFWKNTELYTSYPFARHQLIIQWFNTKHFIRNCSKHIPVTVPFFQTPFLSWEHPSANFLDFFFYSLLSTCSSFFFLYLLLAARITVWSY